MTYRTPTLTNEPEQSGLSRFLAKVWHYIKLTFSPITFFIKNEENWVGITVTKFLLCVGLGLYLLVWGISVQSDRSAREEAARCAANAGPNARAWVARVYPTKIVHFEPRNNYQYDLIFANEQTPVSINCGCVPHSRCSIIH